MSTDLVPTNKTHIGQGVLVHREDVTVKISYSSVSQHVEATQHRRPLWYHDPINYTLIIPDVTYHMLPMMLQAMLKEYLGEPGTTITGGQV